MSATVGKQSARQAARREALESQARLRARRVEREKRLSRLGVWVTAAMRERDAAVAMYEQRAAGALTQMVQEEGATWAEAADWCGDCVTPRDVTPATPPREDHPDHHLEHHHRHQPRHEPRRRAGRRWVAHSAQPA